MLPVQIQKVQWTGAATMSRLTNVHWLDTAEVDFFQRVMTLVAEDYAVGRGSGRTWVAPHEAIYSWRNSHYTLRGKNSLESINIDNDEFENPVYSKTYIQTGVVNQPGHWTFTSILLREGDKTHQASTCTAMDTFKSCTTIDDCSSHKLQTLCRGSMYSLQTTEPSRLRVPLVLPVHSLQDDASSCGAMSLAYMCLTAMGLMDPHSDRADDPKAPWNICIPTGKAIYEWLGAVLESVDVLDCEPVRKQDCGREWMPIPPHTNARVTSAGDGPLYSTVELTTPYDGHPKLANDGRNAYKHVRCFKPGKSSTTRDGKHISRDLVDSVYAKWREGEGIAEVVVPDPPQCQYGCGRDTRSPTGLAEGPAIDSPAWCIDPGGLRSCLPTRALRWETSTAADQRPPPAGIGNGGMSDGTTDAAVNEEARAGEIGTERSLEKDTAETHVGTDNAASAEKNDEDPSEVTELTDSELPLAKRQRTGRQTGTDATGENRDGKH
jgi:hypothetical protein